MIVVARLLISVAAIRQIGAGAREPNGNPLHLNYRGTLLAVMAFDARRGFCFLELEASA